MASWNALRGDASHGDASPRRRAGAVATLALVASLVASTACATEPDSSPVVSPAVTALPAAPVGPRTEPAADPDPGVATAPLAADLSALLAGMRSAPGVIAQFTETKELALLSAPLESTGTIYFVPPDRLVRVVTSPGRSRLVVDGDKVRFEDDNGRKALDLSASPMARQLIDSFVVLFNGDEARLKELYVTEFSSDGTTWRLRLLPRSAPLNRMVGSFDLTGAGARIDRMESVEPDGDRTVTLFGETNAQHRFGAEELVELFEEGPAS